MSQRQKPPEQLDWTGHPSRTKTISKSKFISGLQCHKLFWHVLHASAEIPPPSSQVQALFKQGAEIGQLARSLFPNGKLLSAPKKPQKAMAQTLAELEHKLPLFEVSAHFDGGAAVVDIVVPLDSGGLEMIEVKSSTSLKSVHIFDLAFQYFIFKNAGIDIRQTSVWHIDREFEWQGSDKLYHLFQKREVTEAVIAHQPEIEQIFVELKQIQALSESPDIEVGGHCFSPFSCPLFKKCWAFMPDHPVTDLFRGRKLALEMMQTGVLSIKDIPQDAELTDRQGLQVATVKRGDVHVNHDGIEGFMKQLQYPLHFFDLESFQTAIPFSGKAKPYEQIPFQFSLHIQHEPGGDCEHRYFLAESMDDPRPAFAESLRASLKSNGSIVAFNASFEQQRIREVAEHYPQFKDWATQVNNRFVDLHQPFARLHFYHPDQHGSTSMKKLLPILTESNYGDLDIQDGHTASIEFKKMVASTTPTWLRQKIREQLLAYCAQDTLGMVHMLDALRKLLG